MIICRRIATSWPLLHLLKRLLPLTETRVNDHTDEGEGKKPQNRRSISAEIIKHGGGRLRTRAGSGVLLFLLRHLYRLLITTRSQEVQVFKVAPFIMPFMMLSQHDVKETTCTVNHKN